jgi:DNA invertase Pin-like site-specific DNA recombinase
MLQYAEKNHQQVGAVVVWKFDRFARIAGDHLTSRLLKNAV